MDHADFLKKCLAGNPFTTEEIEHCKLISEMDKPTTDLVIPLATRLYQTHFVGGPLHITLDDGNIDNGSIEYCIQDAIGSGDLYSQYLGEALLKMSQTQRKKVYLRH